MNKTNKTGIVVILIIVLIGGAAVFLYSAWQGRQEWPRRFRTELDEFFGEGNWEWVSEETRSSSMFEEGDIHSSYPYSPQIDRMPGKYHVWNIVFTNRNGEKELWVLSDHTMMINHAKNKPLSPGRYSPKQAFTQQLMEISMEAAQEEIKQEILYPLLSEKEADCLDVSISYHNGNPTPEMYDELIKQPWFKANEVMPSDYIDSSLHDFYIWIRAHDYKVDKLTESERQHLMDSLDELEKMLKETYGTDVGYEIYLDEEHKGISI